MKHIFRSPFALGACLCLLAASLNGCIITSGPAPDPDPAPAPRPDPEPAPAPAPGEINVNVTIDGANDFLVCSDFQIDAIEVSLVGHSEINTVTTDCNDLGVTLVDVPEGVYDVEVRLLSAGHVVSEPGIATVKVISGGSVTIDVDFPASSIS